MLSPLWSVSPAGKFLWDSLCAPCSCLVSVCPVACLASCVLPASWPVLVVVMSLRLMLLADAQTWTASRLSVGRFLGQLGCSAIGQRTNAIFSLFGLLCVGSSYLHYFALFNIIWFWYCCSSAAVLEHGTGKAWPALGMLFVLCVLFLVAQHAAAAAATICLAGMRV